MIHCFYFKVYLELKSIASKLYFRQQLLTRTVPVNNFLLTGTVPVNNCLLTGTLKKLKFQKVSPTPSKRQDSVQYTLLQFGMAQTNRHLVYFINQANKTYFIFIFLLVDQHQTRPPTVTQLLSCDHCQDLQCQVVISWFIVNKQPWP